MSEEIIWRYLEDWKFRSLISNENIFIANAFRHFNKSIFQEGYITSKERAALNKKFNSTKGIDNFLLKQKRKTYLSCWCKTESEDLKMWEEYVGKSNGVAIKTTKRKLKKAISSKYANESYYFKDVNYIDPINSALPKLNVVDIYSRKIDKYRFENEFRAFIQLYNRDTLPDSLNLPVDVNDFINNEVIISPYSDSSYGKEIKELIEDYENLKVITSNF